MVLLNAISLQMFQNKSPAEHLQIYKKMCFICNDERNGFRVNIMKVTRAVGYMKPHVIFFVIANCLILLLCICIITNHTLFILLENQIKIIMTKKPKICI